ncbi:MAG: porin [Gallionella sp.]|nr:porin [Gallionella sp.]
MQKPFSTHKKLIVVALAATAFSTPALAETANVSVYGRADLSFDVVNTGTAANSTAGVSKNNVSSNVSRLGFKGAEGLGEGLSAIWQIEQQINMDNAGAASNSGTGNTLGSRNTFAGLKSDSMGTVLLGRHDTPYKLATRKLDIFGDSIADNRALLGSVSGKSAAAAFDGRQPDVIAYISPELSGFTGAIAYVNLNEGATTTLTTATPTVAQATAGNKASALSLMGTYNSGSIYAALGYELHDLGTAHNGTAAAAATKWATGAKESAWKLGLGYTMDAFTLGFAYEKTSDNLGALGLTPVAGGNLYGHNAYYLSANYKMGMNAVKAAYGKAGQLGATLNTGSNQFSLGYDHGLSKRTKLYAIYSRISNQSAASYGFSQTTATSINGVGASPSVVSLGLQHNF